MPVEQVTVGVYRDLPEALLAKGKVESAGIECSLADDNIVRMDWFWANAVGGIKLRVPVASAAAALQVLSAEIPAALPADFAEYQQPRCPRCRSLDVRFTRLNRPLSYLLAWLGFPVPVPARHWECAGCGARWKWEGAGEYDDPQAPDHGQEN